MVHGCMLHAAWCMVGCGAQVRGVWGLWHAHPVGRGDVARTAGGGGMLLAPETALVVAVEAVGRAIR